MYMHIFSTEKGSTFRTLEEIAAAERVYKTAIKWKTDKQMADDFQASAVRAILDGPLCERYQRPPGKQQLRKRNNFQKNPNVFAGAWAHIPIRTGKEGLIELERCLRQLKMIGLVVNQSRILQAVTTPASIPFYELCDSLQRPGADQCGSFRDGRRVAGRRRAAP